MTILWCGGEDIDFPLGTGIGVGGGGSSYYRTAYARCAVYNQNGSGLGSCRTLSFAGGSLTSFWLHYKVYGGFSNTSIKWVGVSLNSAANGAGLYLGNDSSNNAKLVLYKFDGTSYTAVASETGSSFSFGVLHQLDMQVTNFGASSVVAVYIDGSLVISFSGSITISGVTAFDCCSIIQNGSGAYFYGASSEIIVADADTRGLSVMTMAPSAAGDTNNWTGAYTAVNPVTINDSSTIVVNTTGQDFEANLTDLVSGTWQIRAVKIAARAELTAGSTPTGIKLGVKTGGTLNVGGAQTPTVAFTTFESLLTQNPVTSAAWVQSDMNALQLALESS